jgi:sugar lactone lactonase YvrE
MGKTAEPQAGAIYRFFKGELRKLVPNVTVSNAISFAPDRSVAYYTDTHTYKVMCIDLHPDTGWPEGDARVHLDLTAFTSGPDGAVTDTQGNLWLACWGASMVACYAPDGSLITKVNAAAKQTSCPTFGGPDLRDLYITSAAIGLDDDTAPHNGRTFVARNAGQGVAEPRVIL